MPGKSRGWGKGHRSTSCIGQLHKGKRGLQERKKDDVDDDEVDEEVEISWEVPKDLENVVEVIVADLETETVSSTK